MRPGILLGLFVALAGCGVGPSLPAPPTGVTAVTVAPVENRTGGELVVAGDFLGAKWIGREKKTVADVMREESRTVLRDHGVKVDGGGAPTLRVTLERFEPDLPQLAWVEVALTATLTDPDGTVRWKDERSRWLIPTSGSPSLAAAYDTAARTVARQLLDGWAATAAR